MYQCLFILYIIGTYLNSDEFFSKFPDYGYASSMIKLDGKYCGNYGKRGDNGSYVIEHKPSQLNKCVRWMVYNPPNIEACGLALPATSNPNGRYEAHKNGEYVVVPSANGKPGKISFDLRYGYLNESMTKVLEKRINASNKKQFEKINLLKN